MKRRLIRKKAFASIAAALFAIPGSARAATPIQAVPVNDFLSSLGVNTHIDQGVPWPSYVQPFQYTGIRNLRDTTGNPKAPGAFVSLHRQTGVLVDACGYRYDSLLAAANSLASAGALMAVEGPNEPNNFKIKYPYPDGPVGGGVALTSTWIPVAQYQRDLYAFIKGTPSLSKYPVFHVSEGGAETDNAGMQWLTIPTGAGTVMPDGTKYADYANSHNYVAGNGNCGVLQENQAWNAADPNLRKCWDGLPGNYGTTWKKHFPGHSDAQLLSLPRVTTETGWGTQGPGAITEDQQGKLFLNLYLSQFKRGWRYTFIYEMRDQEGGDILSMGLFHKDSTPKIAATYIHNLTTILADTISKPPGSLNYSIPQEPPAVHDLLMQKSDGTFWLVVWDERVAGTTGMDNVTVDLDETHASVTVYDPTIGTAATQTFSNVSSIPLSLGDHPLLVAISGS